jgi:hypothetical protein
MIGRAVSVLLVGVVGLVMAVPAPAQAAWGD